MGHLTKDEIKGKVNKAKGAAKESLGRALGNRNMENKGAEERRSGTAQENVGKAKRKVHDAIRDLEESIRK